ncbi:MAG: ABC transporter permease [Anaerolineae bacterium]|nr:ABC transporter permease [Anaerolineae bacterium]
MGVQTAALTTSPVIARLRRLLGAREAGVFIALMLMIIFLSVTTDAFLSGRNLLNIGRQVALLGILSVGMTFVLIAGEVDLSIGSTYALSGIATGMLIVDQWALLPALLAGILIGVVVGAINGVISTYGRLPSFITTLGMLSIVRGAALLITNGDPVTVNRAAGADETTLAQFTWLGQGNLFGQIPMQLVFFIIIAIIGAVLLALMTYGFKVYAVGGSAKAARVSGINVFSVKIWAFVIMGALSAIAGILGLAFLPSAQAGRTGVGLELDVIAATIVGGASLSGGEGTMLGTVLGVLIIGVLRNGLILLNISPFWQTTIIGLVIIVAVAIDKWTVGRRNS